MKKITLLLILLTFSIGYSQDLLLGFEPGESGGVNGGPFGDGPAPVVEMGSGTNTTQVLKIVGNPSGQPWQGINLNLTSLVNLTNTQTMTMDVFSADPITFLVKVTGGTGGPAISAASVSHPGGSVWQTVSFTFNTSLDGQPAPASGVYNGFVIHTYWAPGATTFFNPTIPTPPRTFYVDNIRGPLGTPPVDPAPTVAAPTPPARPAADVKSIFSNAYTPVTVIGYSGDDNTYNTSWCPGTTSLVQIQGNDTNKTVGLGCEGVDFRAGRFDASSFTFLHMDVWTATPLAGKFLDIKFSNWNGTTGETNAFQINWDNGSVRPFPAANADGWITIDVPMSSLTCVNTPPGNACPSKSDFTQFVITSNLGTIYYDNLYLHKNTVLSNTQFDLVTFNVYPNPASNNVNVKSSNTIENVALYSILGQEILTKAGSSNEMNIDISGLQNGVYLMKAQIEGQVKTTRIIKE